MNIFKELKRVERHKPLKPWLKQDGVVIVEYAEKITVGIHPFVNKGEKSVYVPMINNGRKVEVRRMSKLEFYDNLWMSGNFLCNPF